MLLHSKLMRQLFNILHPAFRPFMRLLRAVYTLLAVEEVQQTVRSAVRRTHHVIGLVLSIRGNNSFIQGYMAPEKTNANRNNPSTSCSDMKECVLLCFRLLSIKEPKPIAAVTGLLPIRRTLQRREEKDSKH